jgi:hypothetical protein
MARSLHCTRPRGARTLRVAWGGASLAVVGGSWLVVMRGWAVLCMAGAIRARCTTVRAKPLALESKGLAHGRGDAATRGHGVGMLGGRRRGISEEGGFFAIRDTTALQEGVVFEMGPSPPGSPSERREAVRGNPKQIGGRSLRGEPQTCRSPLLRDSGREPVPTATVRAISRSRPASLSRGSGSQYYRRPGF